MARLFDPPDRLTPRQHRIMHLTHMGKTDEEICRALRFTPRTLRWHSTQIRKVFPTFRLPLPLPPTLLTERERQIAVLVAAGLSNRAISEALILRPGTVKQCVKNIYSKTQTENRVDLALTILIVQNKVLIGASEAA